MTLDLRRLVDTGLLLRTGRTRATEYVASPALVRSWRRASLVHDDVAVAAAAAAVRARDVAAVRATTPCN